MEERAEELKRLLDLTASLGLEAWDVAVEVTLDLHAARRERGGARRCVLDVRAI